MFYMEKEDLWIAIEEMSIYPKLDAIILTGISYIDKGKIEASYILVENLMQNIVIHKQEFDIHSIIKAKFVRKPKEFKEWIENEIVTTMVTSTSDVEGNETEYNPNSINYIIFNQEKSSLNKYLKTIKAKYYSNTPYVESDIETVENNDKLSKQELVSSIDKAFESDEIFTKSIKEQDKVEKIDFKTIDTELLNLIQDTFEEHKNNLLLINIEGYSVKGTELVEEVKKDGTHYSLEQDLEISLQLVGFTLDLKQYIYNKKLVIMLPDITSKNIKAVNRQISPIIKKLKILESEELYNIKGEITTFEEEGTKLIYKCDRKKLKMLLQEGFNNHTLKNSNNDIKTVLGRKINMVTKSIADRVVVVQDRETQSKINYSKYGYKEVVSAPFKIVSKTIKKEKGTETIYLSLYFGYAESVFKDRTVVHKLYDYSSTTENATTNINTILGFYNKYASYKSDDDKKEFLTTLESILNRRKKLIVLD